MLFNSPEFIFGLLPISLLVYFLAARVAQRLAIWWLVGVSLFFYAWWRTQDLPLFAGSILFNFCLARLLQADRPEEVRRRILLAAIAVNLAVLGFFKYGRFFSENISALVGHRLPFPEFVLPLGISFFTFTQITYLVDTFKYRRGGHPLSSYSLFASFYPHLLAGPILHHQDMMPQFADPENRVPRVSHLWRGLALFGVGLCKKVLLADVFAPYVHAGFDVMPAPSLLDSWLSVLAYTFQIYFDFSGYTDMAIGAALLFNIRLPFNFNSPYRSTDIQAFWRRWHITLGAFFRDYVYIPLGGNRLSGGRTMVNLFLVALLSGLWHGAAWSFVLWGALHGAAMVLHHLWRRTGLALWSPLAWAVIFLFICLTWVPFRAKDWPRARLLLAGLSAQSGIVVPSQPNETLNAARKFLKKKLGVRSSYGVLATAEVNKLLLYLGLGFALVLLPWNSNVLVDPSRHIPLYVLVAIGLGTCWSILNLSKLSEFIYFNF